MNLIVINNLANAIKNKGMTQAQFADKLGIDQPTVSRLCKQKRYTLKRLQDVMEALNETDVSKIIRVVQVND
ncbi:helix-turn-helix transcriptional regulator [Bacillus sp. FJAT-45037]|uniref:helix-turn-helix transcriptional regulator n=1 Tax=Bacillus sp. FJAT-45037 TaxID=2011007 RepID=UPI0012FDB4DD|nr:helix-turn-helix transcriptional regulator [Bacillus sp. FJAT-45037]